MAARFWILGITGVWDLAANWSATTGGAGGASVPGINDTANFDLNGLGDCNCDVTTVGVVAGTSGYTGKVEQQNAFVCEGAFSLSGGEWDTNAFDLTSKGDLLAEGVGNGLVQTTGGTIFIGAGFDFDTGSADVVVFRDFVGGAFVEHDTVVTVSSTDIPNITVEDNNSLRIFNNSATLNDLNMLDGSRIKDDGGGPYTFTIRGDLLVAATDSENIIAPTSSGSLEIRFNGTDIEGANYNGADIRPTSSTLMLIVNRDITGVNDVILMRTFVSSPCGIDTNGFNLIVDGNTDIGSDTNTGINGRLLVRSGDTFDCAGYVHVNETDGVQECYLEYESGALDSDIGSLVVDALCELRTNTNSLTIAVAGDVIITPTSVCDFSTTTVDQTETGDLENDTSGNTFFLVKTAASGKTNTMTARLNLANVIFGGGTFDMGGFVAEFRLEVSATVNIAVGADITTFVNPGNLSLRFNGPNNVTLPPINGIKAMNLIGSSGPAGAVTVNMTGDITCTGSATFRANTGSLCTLNLNDFTYTCDFCTWGLTSQSAILNFGTSGALVAGTIRYDGALNECNGAGTINCTKLINEQGTMELSGINLTNTGEHQLDVGATCDVGSGAITTLGIFVPLGAIDFGNGIYAFSNTFDLSGASSVTYGSGSRLFVFGTGSPAVTLGNNGATNISIQMGPGGNVSFLDTESFSGEFKHIANNDFTITMPIPALGTLSTANWRGIGSQTDQATYVSSTPATQWDFPVTNNNTIFHADITDANVSTATITADTNTGTDGGNNTGPSPGITFAAVTPVSPATGQQTNTKISIGISI